MKYTVTVHGEDFEIEVHKKSASRWVAIGEYVDDRDPQNIRKKHISATARSETAAREQWILEATYFGD